MYPDTETDYQSTELIRSIIITTDKNVMIPDETKTL